MTIDTIVVLKTLNQNDFGSLCLQYGPLLLAFAGLLYTAMQLRASATSTLLQSEVMLFDNLRRIANASADIKAFEADVLSLPKDTEPQKEAIRLKLRAVEMRKQSAIENYLNSLDRFCGIVLRRIVSRRRTKREYLSILDSAVSEFQNDVPNFNEHFPNLIRLRGLWRS